MKTKTLLASLAASSLVLAHPAAAATRSYESLPTSGVQSVQSVDGQRTGTAVGETEEISRRGLLYILFTLGLAALLIILLNGGTKSPG